MSSTSFRVRTTLGDYFRGVWRHAPPRPFLKWFGLGLVVVFVLGFLATFVIAVLVRDLRPLLPSLAMLVLPLVLSRIPQCGQLTFDEERIHLISRHVDRRVAWRDIVSWSEQDGLLTLELDRYRFFVVPSRDLPEATVSQLRHYLGSSRHQYCVPVTEISHG